MLKCPVTYQGPGALGMSLSDPHAHAAALACDHALVGHKFHGVTTLRARGDALAHSLFHGLFLLLDLLFECGIGVAVFFELFFE